MNSRDLTVIAAVVAALPLCAVAQSAEPGFEGRVLGETLYETMDTSGRGFIQAGDLERFRDSVFAGMDYDRDLKVTYEEFAAWDPGFRRVAEDLGRADAYMTASKIVFAFWDRDGDGDLTEREMRVSMSADFRRADQDSDHLLTEEEFLSGFPIMIAMRAAIRPDL